VDKRTTKTPENLYTTKISALVYKLISTRTVVLNSAAMSVELDFNEERYMKLLTNLIGETKYLQDNPPKFVPEESRYEVSDE